MTLATFDTLKLSRRLEAAGFSREQSAGVAEALNDTLGGDLVTRDYLDARLARVEADIAEVKAELKADIAAVKTDIAAVKTDIAAQKADILKWVFAALIGQTAVIAALVKLL